MSGLALIMNELGFKVQGSDLVNNKNIIRLGGTRYFILKLLKTKNYTKIPCIIFSKEKIKNKKQINIKLVSKLTGLHYEKIFRSIR